MPSNCPTNAMAAFTNNIVTTAIPNHGRSMIPGLAFSQPSDWQGSWMNTSAIAGAMPSSSLPTGNAAEVTAAIPDVNAGIDESESNSDSMEEGELSEGELEEEDAYEPQDFEPTRPNQGGDPKSHVSASLSQEVGGNVEDRSRSYSPYLSPREMNASHNSNLPGLSQATQDNGTSTASVACSSLSSRITQDASRCSSPITEARKQAQDAILRLWPLNVRFQDYLEEGVDKGILQSLFTDLGLATTKSASDQPASPLSRTKSQHILTSTRQPVQSNSHELASPGDKAPSKRPGEPQLSVSRSNDAMPEPKADLMKDTAESRKDRIARLLAAKSTKPTSAPTEPITQPDTPSFVTNAAPAKIQSEKSRLLQQKMEALKKARETKAQSANIKPKESTPPAPVSKAVASKHPNNKESVLSEIVSQGPELSNKSEVINSLPRVDASPPTQQPSKSINQQKRPMASDLNEMSDNSAKRPFGHNRQARPFLIDVSDDDEDVVMDIDSPELKPTADQALSSPFTIPSLPNFGMPLHTSLSRQDSIASAGPTPTTPAGCVGKVDLEFMNKEIKMMKRKIAEAEARKKAKVSNGGTPSQSPNVQSEEGVAVDSGTVTPKSDIFCPISRSETPHIPGSLQPALKFVPVTIRTPGTPQSAQHATPIIDHESSNVSSPVSPRPGSRRLPKLSDKRGLGQRNRSRSRSRAASERLPIIEAHRKEKLLQLQQLQQQVRRMEEEIEQTKREEDRLRDEALEVGSDDEMSEVEELGADCQEDLSLRAASSTRASVEMQIPEQASSVELSADATCRAPTEPSNHSSTSPAQGQAEGAQNDSPSSYEEGENMSPTQQTSLEHDAQAVAPEDDNESVAMSDSSEEYEPTADNATEAAIRKVQDDNEADTKPEVYDAPVPERTDSSSDSPEAVSSDAVASDGMSLDDKDQSQPIDNIDNSHPLSSDKSSELGRKEDIQESNRGEPEVSKQTISGSDFVPYESPLQYFHAYRFHPKYNDAVSGGLRSMTYSNKIDVRKQVCPDQLANSPCPRGKNCDYQHFETMRAPDDQILLQLGACDSIEGDRKTEFIAGLRKLLTDYKKAKIKDFKTISEGIINYRAQFRGDGTKILPLGRVNL